MYSNEQELIAGCLKKHPQAQQALYYKFCNTMLGVCYRYAKNKEDAEDMLQEAFIKVFANIDSFRNEGSLEGWIRRIVIHTCINNLKKNKKLNDIVEINYVNEIGSNPNNLPGIIEAKQVIDCIRLLPLGFRTVINLFAIEGFSHSEIAKMLDIQESTSRSQYTRGKAMLEQMLVDRNILIKKQYQKKKIV